MGITINSRILLSVASIIAAAALIVGATFAFFSDEETSSNNVFAAGNLDLVLCDDDENTDTCESQEEGPEDSVEATFGGTDLAPGDCLGEQVLTLRNNGTIDGEEVDITASNTNGAMSPFLRIDTLTYGGANLLDLTDDNGNAINDLHDLAAGGLPNLPGLDATEEKDLVMNVCLDESADNSTQGASNTLSLTTTLKQVAD
jgi:predicted ribosomally synthesized peptide with SipW-like signal peptide